MTTNRIVMAASVALLLLGPGCQVKEAPESEPASANLPAVPGKAGPAAFSLAEHKGKVVLVDFWATWCGPCRSEIPAMNKIHEDYKAAGNLAVVGLSVDRMTPGALTDAARSLGIAYPVVLADESLQQQFGEIRAVPTKFLIDKAGRVRKTFVGVVPPDEIRRQITALLAE